jgi:hypothetical protein
MNMYAIVHAENFKLFETAMLDEEEDTDSIFLAVEYFVCDTQAEILQDSVLQRGSHL